MANQWRDKIEAYKRGDKITTNMWRDKIEAHKREDEILVNQWEDKILSCKKEDVTLTNNMLPKTMLPRTMLLLTRVTYKLMWTVTTHTLMRGVFPRLQRRGMPKSHWTERCPRNYLREQL